MPKARYAIIPQAPEWIEQTLAELRIRPLDPKFTPAVAQRKRARFYMTPVLDQRGRLAWFKATLQNSPGLRPGLREEIRVQKTFAEYERRGRPAFDSPSYIASHDNRRGFIWLLRKYWQGLYAGDMDHWFGLNPTFFRRVAPVAMARILGDVRKMTPLIKRRIALPTHDLGWYLLDFHFYRRNFFRPLLSSNLNPGWKLGDIDRLEELLHDHRRFLRRQAVVFSHGDFYPNNIMVRPGGSRPVVLFDWELSHLNLPTFDAVMLYLHAWRHPVWRERFKRETLDLLGQTASARLSWRLATLSLATRLAGFGFIRLTNSQPDRYPHLPLKQRPVMTRMFRSHLDQLRRAYLDELT